LILPSFLFEVPCFTSPTHDLLEFQHGCFFQWKLQSSSLLVCIGIQGWVLGRVSALLVLQNVKSGQSGQCLWNFRATKYVLQSNRKKSEQSFVNDEVLMLLAILLFTKIDKILCSSLYF